MQEEFESALLKMSVTEMPLDKALTVNCFVKVRLAELIRADSSWDGIMWADKGTVPFPVCSGPCVIFVFSIQFVWYYLGQSFQTTF